jgi:hypothetical protein
MLAITMQSAVYKPENSILELHHLPLLSSFLGAAIAGAPSFRGSETAVASPLVAFTEMS